MIVSQTWSSYALSSVVEVCSKDVVEEGDESEGDEVVGGLNDKSSSGGEEFDDSDNEYEYRMKDDQDEEEDVAVEKDDSAFEGEELIDNVIKETRGEKSEAMEENFDVEGLRVDDSDVDKWPVICVDGYHLKGPHGGEDIEKYTHQCYRVQTYLKAYQHPIFPINGRDEWKKSDLSPPVPPKAVKRVGRPPKSSRRLELDEPMQKNKNKRGAPMKEGSSRIKRQQTIVKCGKCGSQGHNARGYTTKTVSNELVSDASSQVPPIKQPQKKQVRGKCKGIMQNANVFMHRRTRIAAPVIGKLQDRKTPKPSATTPSIFHQFQQCHKEVKIKEPAPFIDAEVGERSLDEQGV
ncbi:UNVERIFIED_CONTAM: hypothetical protein Scaly_2809500 [Sesamum calycinum]|uniref:Uncharacterized protein n=1 Tax=Sesamum calycinum TaxID=2727403 RepID=A0AAW2IUH9_9LAMI